MGKKLHSFALIQYGLLALPLSFAGLPIYIHAPNFYATEFGISLSAIGIILLVVRAFDAIQDPLIGYICDTYKNHLKAIIVASYFIFAVGLFMLFHPTQTLTLLWFAISLILATSAFSILTINLTTIGNLWGASINQMTNINAFREGFGLIGLLAASIAPTLLLQIYEPQKAWNIFALVTSSIIFVSIGIFLKWMKQISIIPKKPTPDRISSNLWIHIQNQKRFYISYGLSMLASAIPTISVLFYIKDIIGAQHLTGVFLIIYFLSGILSIPFWKWAAQRFNLKTAWVTAMVLAAISFVWASFLKSGDIAQYSTICILTGFALGAELTMPPAMLTQNIERSASQNYATSQFAILAFLTKFALALSAGLILPLLDYANYTAQGQNSTQSLQALSLYYAALPCVIKLAAVACLLSLKTPNPNGDQNEKILTRSMSYEPSNPL